MSNADIVREQINAFNEQNWEKWSSVSAEDCIYEEIPTHKKIEGRENVIEFISCILMTLTILSQPLFIMYSNLTKKYLKGP